jgi:WD40 repeat protein
LSFFCEKVGKEWSETVQISMPARAAHSNGVYCIQYDEERLVSGSRDHKLRIWDFRTLTLRHTMTGHEGSVLCLQVNTQLSSECSPARMD